MNITIEAPAGPRNGVVPFEGIADEATLVKSLILTLAEERRAGIADVTLTVDCSSKQPGTDHYSHKRKTQKPWSVPNSKILGAHRNCCSITKQEKPMNITIEAPAGPRNGVVPFEGIADEATLVKSLILTLAVERRAGIADVTLTVDCSRVDANRLVTIANLFGHVQIALRCDVARKQASEFVGIERRRARLT